MITIVNVKTAKRGTYEYCGRRNARYGLKQSPLANREPLLREKDRERILSDYADWFEQMTNADNAAFDAEIMRLHWLDVSGDLALGCWCYPKRPCHCEVIKDFLEHLRTGV